MVICLERGADLHTARMMPLPFTVSCFSKIQIGLPFWYRLTRVFLDKGPLNGCVCVCGINTIVHLYTAVRLTSVVTDYFFCAVNFVAENTFLSFIIGPLSPVRWSQLFKQCVSHVDVVA